VDVTTSTEDCSLLPPEHECHQNGKSTSSAVTVLIIFGGATILLLLIYTIIAIRKCYRDRKNKEENPDPKEELEKDYEKFKKLKFLEL